MLNFNKLLQYFCLKSKNNDFKKNEELKYKDESFETEKTVLEHFLVFYKQ